jgi:hypothetical protein
VTIGDQTYESDQSSNAAGLQILAVDASSLAATQETFPTDSGSTFDGIKSFLAAVQPGEIVIISSTQSSGTYNKELSALLAGDATNPGFGGNSEIGNLPAAFAYTFIGMKGNKYDNGYTLARDPNYTGYFVPDSKGYYRYFQPDFVKFQIKDPENAATITVGDNVYTAPPLLNGAQGGFHVLILDRFTLTPFLDGNGQPFNRTYATGSVAFARSEAERMATDLQNVANIQFEGVLFFISSIGQPAYYQPDSAIIRVMNSNATTNHGNITITCLSDSGSTTVSSGQFVIGHYADMNVSVSCPADYANYDSFSWTHTGSGDHATLAAQTPNNTIRPTSLPSVIEWLGGNPSVIANLGASDTYALAGGRTPDYDKAPAFPSVESSSLLMPEAPAGAIRGVLHRNNRGIYEPLTSDFDLSAPIDYELYTRAWQDPIPWPVPTNADEQKAYQCISQVVSCSHLQDCQNEDVRASYVNQLEVISELATYVSELPYEPTRQGCTEADFSADAFLTVRDQLHAEFQGVDRVRQLRNQVQEMLVESASTAQGYLHDIAQQIKDDVKPADTSPVVINILKALGGVAQIASAAIPSAQVAATAVTGVIGAALNASASLASTAPNTIDGRVDTTVGELSDEADKNFVATSDAVGVMIQNLLIDWGKIEFVSSRIGSNAQGWVWNFDDATRDTLALAVRRHYYQRLMPIPYAIFQRPGAAFSDRKLIACGNGPSTDPHWNPFGDAPDDAYAASLDFNSGSQPPGGWNVFVLAENKTLSRYDRAHYASFADTLFNPYQLDGLAITKLELFTWWPLPRQFPCP